jgi:hypothetical protein
MTKAALLISGLLLFAGVAAASSLTSRGGSDTPSLDTPSLATTTGNDVRREDRREAEDLRGPCDEAEHADDPRCTGAADAQARGDDDGDRHNRGPGGTGDSGGDDGNSGHRGGNSGPGGGDDD